MLMLLLSCVVALGPEIVVDEVMVLPPAGPGGRAPFRVDPVQGAIVRGGFGGPSAGPSFAGKEWKRLESKDGWFQDRALVGGYAHAVVPSDAERVMVLEASGHLMLYWNGECRGGDPYEYGSVRVPVLLKKGENEVLAQAGRGRLRMKLVEPLAPVSLDLADATLPDLVQGQGEPVVGGLVVVNATGTWQQGLVAAVACEGAASSTYLPPVPPMTVRKVPVSFTPPVQLSGTDVEYSVTITGPNLPAGAVPAAALKLRVRTPGQTRKVTFTSGIDGSVQYYCVNPAQSRGAEQGSSAPEKSTGLVLSLHGASVEATNQADAYRSKPDLDLVAPTNRRPFGFDWEDWGRADGMEVLEHATRSLKPDSSRVYLTGHSMGGHGTWQLGAIYPDRFAAIAPSAGWISFWSYGGARESENPTPLERLFRRAMGTSDTLKLSRNYLMQGVYVLHGDADDNVPVTQARQMREHLGKYHPDFAYYERPGAGHWWGNECVDWEPIFEFFAKRRLRPNAEVDRIEFTTANPAVSASCRWVSILQQQRMCDFSTVVIELDREKRTFNLKEAENVERLRLDLGHLSRRGDSSVYLSGGDFAMEITPRPGEASVELLKDSRGWRVTLSVKPSEKNPQRGSGWKQVIGNRVVLVYGTAGTPEEDSWALNKARFDAETWWYRGNGAFDIVADVDFNPDRYKDRNVLLYGNMETNSAWKTLLMSAPIRVTREGIVAGSREFVGEGLVAMFVYRHPESHIAVVGAVAPTGMEGCRAAERIGYFGSGVAYPDWTVFSSEVFEKGLGGVNAAGYFGNHWDMAEVVE